MFGVYIHFPFCASRCGYCDFATTAAAEIPHRRYADVVLAELLARSEAYRGHGPAGPVYVGGGTPSLWDAAQLARVLGAALEPGVGGSVQEVTLEANPGDVCAASVDGWRRAGVNRLSIGLQSLDDRCLRLLGRRHDARQARRAVALARRHGFASLSCDVMFALPGQTVAHHLAQLSAVLELAPDHVSVYSLSLSPRSPLGRGGLRPGDDAVTLEMMERGRDLLQSAGLRQYEVSSYARPGHESAHNSLVWAGAPYLGLGAHAHSMLPRGQATLRRENPGTMDYLAGAGAPIHERVAPPGSWFEHAFLALRTRAGIARGRYRARFGADPVEHFGRALRRMERAGHVELDADAIRPTAGGIWLADELALGLLE